MPRPMGRIWRCVAAGLAVVLLLGELPLLWGASAAQTMVTLREGREIEAEMIDDARSGSVAPADEVRFRVLEAVEVHGQVALPAGSEGALVVGEVERNGMLGKPGRVSFAEGWIEAGGEKVPVAIKGRSVFKGKSKKTVAVVLTLVLVGPFIKGGQGGIAAGEHIFVQIKATSQVPAVE